MQRYWQTVNSLKACLKSANLLPNDVGQCNQAAMFQCLVIVLIEPGKAVVCFLFTQGIVTAIELQQI